uniref:receptor protein-tyrosine kinase n=1 Tax=Callorhinchus milii TaxID=7868 RepID=A0A4W3IV93_CALMI
FHSNELLGVHNWCSTSLDSKFKGHRPLQWSWPKNHSRMEHRISMIDCSNGTLFCKKFMVTKTIANDTGMYQCSYKNSSDQTAASIYVFVQDYQAPFVNPDKPEVLYISHRNDLVLENKTIPCQVSIPNLNVTLLINYPDKHIVPDGVTTFWDNQKGFTIPRQMIINAGLARCETTIDGNKYQSNMYVLAVIGTEIRELTLNPQPSVELAVGERLILNCTARTELNVRLEFKWKYPGMESPKPHVFNGKIMVLDLTLFHYLFSEKPFIFIDHTVGTIIETVVGVRNVTIPLKVLAYPQPKIKWTKNGRPLSKYQTHDRLKEKDLKYTLMIRDVTKEDAGNYTIQLKNPITKEEQSHTIQLIVNGKKPIFTLVYIQGVHKIFLPPSPPHPVRIDMRLQRVMYFTVSLLPSYGRCRTEHADPSLSAVKMMMVSSLIIQAANVCAMYRCRAINKVGQDEREIIFHVTKGLEINLQPTDNPIEKDNVSLQCRADRYMYENLKWYKLPSSVLQSHHSNTCKNLHHHAQKMTTEMVSNLKTENITIKLSFESVSLEDQGIYLCEAQNKNTGDKFCMIKILSVKAQQAPLVLQNLTDQIVNMSSSIEMMCDVVGSPSPRIIWYKNGKQLLEVSGIILGEFNRTLTIQRLKKEDEGLYKCKACNKVGCVETYAAVAVEGAEDKANPELIILIGTGVIAMFFWLLLIIIIRNIKRPSDAELKAGYLSIIIDPDEVPMNEKCERLSYDASKWEFPRDRLKLGKPLGRGAFGKVVEAAAFGIDKVSTCKTVAVKMLKDGATSSEQRALMSELKILIHIGHHLNVVNLLGACTKAGGPLMVIVEYCKHGNLSNYLRSKRMEFVPYKSKTLGLRQTKEKDSEIKHRLDSIASSGSSTSSGFAEEKSLSDVEEEDALEDPYKRFLSMEDLICYSFQVARGMEFLASRKCIHRDLAARNILLSKNNVVKICDFGLARDIYRDPDYVRKGDARLPLKWMAPETIFDKIYTTQSDVWSFGVLLWEIFSLGASPYPGVQIDEEFCRRLKDGTRMRCPGYATPEIYQTMLDCWHGNYKERPVFSELVEHLGNLLQANAQQDGKDYIPLNMSLTLEDDSGLSLPTSPVSCVEEEEGCELKFYYDNAAGIRYLNGSKKRSRPESVKTFDEVPVQQTTVIDNQTDSGMILASEELQTLKVRQSQAVAFSALIPSKSKESVTSEVSNQTSGYQSGYHSDDTDTTVYTNEEAQVRQEAETAKESYCTLTVDYSPVVRYSAPPV